MSPTDFPERFDDRREPPRAAMHEPPPRRSLGDKRVMAGVAAAVALGLVGGFLMKPNIEDQAPAQRTSSRVVEIPTEPDGLDIVVDTRAPPAEPIATLPPAPYTAPMDGYTPQPVQRVQAPPAQAPRPTPQPRIFATAPAPPPQPRATQAPAPGPRVANGTVMQPYREPARTTRAARTTRPSFNCRYARTASERMVCVDPDLAAADRRLARAYHQAIQSGVPEPVLRRQQDEWLGARESAARYGPQDVERVYEARISELQEMRR